MIKKPLQFLIKQSYSSANTQALNSISAAMVRYAPSTKASVASDPYSLRIRGVVFDMDGTLATPMTEHLVKLHIELGVPSGMGILEYVDELLQGAEREKAERRILEVETEAMANMQLSPGLLELLQFLHDNGLPIAIITRNNQVAAQHFLEQVVTRQPKDQWKWFRFDPVLDRSFKPTKPHPQGLLHISQKWGIPPQELMMVGDHLDDLLCGVRAGSVSALLRYRYNSAYECKAHISVDRIDKIIDSLAHGFEADMAIDGTTDMGGYA